MKHIIVLKSGIGVFFLALQTGCSAPGCRCTVLSTGVLMPFQPMAEKASHPELGTVWSLTAGPHAHGDAVKWQRAPAAQLGNSGGVMFGGHRSLFSAGSNMKGICLFGAQAAMIRYLVFEKISLTPDYYVSDKNYQLDAFFR